MAVLNAIRATMSRVGSDLAEDVGRNEVERRFLRRLTSLQPPEFDVWTDWPQLVVTVDVVDGEENLVLRTLRVDFDGTRIVAGNDPTHQVTDDLDPGDPDRLESPAGLSPEALAQTVAAWLRAQVARPVERQEWIHGDACLQRWVLVDTGNVLTLRKRDGVAWAAGGAWGDPTPPRPPDRAVRLPERRDSA